VHEDYKERIAKFFWREFMVHAPATCPLVPCVARRVRAKPASSQAGEAGGFVIFAVRQQATYATAAFRLTTKNN